ncbi:MAG: DMT family transporter [Alphaproteobacteria bacterium]|nr:MAG: DMT family transporter [Alphaproteobacteria bacterium]
MAKLPPHLYGILVTATGVAALSPDGLLVRLVSTDSWTVLFWRGLLFGIGILGFYFFRFGRGLGSRLRIMGRRGLLAAGFFTLSTIFFVLAITHTSVANTLVIIATAPLFAAIFSRIFLKETIARKTWIAIFICIGAISMIFLGSDGGGTRHGDFFAIIAAFGIAGQVTTVRHARTIDMVPSLGFSGLLTAAVALPIGAPLSITMADFGYLCLLGLIVLPLAFGLITVGPRYIPAPEVSLIMLMESILGPLWVWLGLGEVPKIETVAGGAIVILTLILHSFLGNRQRSP